jgi:hypothetical protein
MTIPVELAAQYILQTEAPLSDIALHCGFTDQAHLRKHFRQSTGQPPAAWHDEESKRLNTVAQLHSRTPASTLRLPGATDALLDGPRVFQFDGLLTTMPNLNLEDHQHCTRTELILSVLRTNQRLKTSSQ